MGGFQNQSQPNLPVSTDKNAQIVDLRGYGYTPERKKGVDKLAESTFKSGKKSMIGKSDFIPVGNIESTANQRALEMLQPSGLKHSPAQSGISKSSF